MSTVLTLLDLSCPSGEGFGRLSGDRRRPILNGRRQPSARLKRRQRILSRLIGPQFLLILAPSSALRISHMDVRSSTQ